MAIYSVFSRFSGIHDEVFIVTFPRTQVATPLTEVAVFADELETIPEEGVVTEEVLAEEPSEAGDVITEDDLIADDQTEVVDDKEDATNGLAEKADEDANMTETEDSSDDLDADTDAPEAPKTSGKVLRLASAGTGIQAGQHIYFGQVIAFSGKQYFHFDVDGTDASKFPYWRVLDAEKSNTGVGNYMFLMSEPLWGITKDENNEVEDLDHYPGNIRYSSDGTEKWDGSNAQYMCGKLYDEVFSTSEQKAVTAFDKVDTPYNENFGTSYLSQSKDKVFLMSAQELQDYVATKGVPLGDDDKMRAGKYGVSGKNARHWLRSPQKYNGSSHAVAFVESNGKVGFGTNLSTTKLCIRPAFNLNAQNILFTSSAQGGKKSGEGPGALTAVENGDVSEWKLTLIDNDSSFSAERVDKGAVKAGSNIKIKYSGAGTSKYYRLSTALCDASGKDVLYYGNIQSTFKAADGETEITIPSGLPVGSYKLMVFSQATYGDKCTDTASKPSIIDIEVIGQKEQTITASDQTKRIGDAAFNLNAKTDGDGKLSYESSDTNVVTVDKNGLVTIKGVGTANITITASETENYKAATKTVKITVTAKQKAEQKITASDQTKTVGDAPFDLKAKTSGDGKLSFKSGDKKVVTVDEDGYVTIIGTGTTTITITAAETANYKAATKVINIIIKAKVEPGKIDIGKAKITGVKSKTYTGKKIKQNPTVKLGGKTLKRGKDYAVKYTSDRVNAGKVTILINGMGDYTGSVLKTFKIKKAAISVKGKTVNVGAGTIKGKGRTIKANKFFKISKNEGEVTYKKTKGLQKITVAKNGDVTLKPGIKKGPHEVKVKVTAAGDKNHKKTIKTVKITVMIK